MNFCPICSSQKIKNYLLKDNFTFFQCLDCRFIWVDILGVDLSDYYNNSNYLHDKIGKGYVDYEADKAPMEPVYVGLLNKIKLYRQGKKLLDLGTATGYFLDVAGQNDYLAEGIEINPSAVKEGMARGRKIKQADILKSGFSDSSFNVITAFDLLEHLPPNGLAEYILAIRKMLVANGILAIITVNTASWWAKIFGKKWHTFLPPEHISYFNDRNIRLFLENNGFEVLEIKTVHKMFSLQYIFNFLYRWQGLSLWLDITRFLEKRPWLGKLPLKLYLGDNMMVLARKICPVSRTATDLT